MVGDGGESKLGEQHTIIGVDINAYSYFHEYNNNKKKRRTIDRELCLSIEYSNECYTLGIFTILSKFPINA